MPQRTTFFFLGNVLGSPVMTFSLKLPEKITQERSPTRGYQVGQFMKKFLLLILKGAPLSQKFPVFTHNVQYTQYSACEGCVPGRAPKATAVRGEAKGSPCLLQCPPGCPALLSLQICPSSVLLGTGNNPLNLWAAQSLWLRLNCWHSSAVMVLCPTVTSGGALTLLVQERCSLGQILCDAEIPVKVEGFFVSCTFYFRLASRRFFFSA